MSHIITDKIYMKSVNLQADTSATSELLASISNTSTQMKKYY